jgi:hypothetical protein
MSRAVKARPEELYAAFMDPDALSQRVTASLA